MRQEDLHRAHHDVRKALGELARLRRKTRTRRRHAVGHHALEAMRLLKEAVERKRAIKASLARPDLPSPTPAPTLIPEFQLAEPSPVLAEIAMTDA